jgi:nucleotide-binding universal stress UspA family protein
MSFILIPVDASDESTNAVIYGAKLSEKLNKEIHLINIYQIPISYSEVPLANISLGEIEEASKVLLENYKNKIEGIKTPKRETKISSINGDVVEEIIQFATENKPYLIIMATKGVGGLERLFLGSNTMSIIKKTKYPILVIPNEVKYHNIEKIGIATDFENVIETTSLAIIKEWVVLFKAKIDVLHVDFERYHFNANTPMETINLDNLLEGMNPTYHYIEEKNSADGLTWFCNKNNIDLLAVYPKRHTWFEQIFEKSNTRQTIKNASIPILCLHRDH